MTTDAIKILYVCTGNICRSPTAELGSRQIFGDDRIMFRSCGLIPDGRRCPPKLIDLLAERGIDASGHRSYQLDAASLRAADLVLTMEASHVQKATLLDPASYPKAMPLKEASAIYEQGFSGGLADLLTHVNTDRDPLRYVDSRLDISDPYGKSTAEYRYMVEEVIAMARRVISALLASTPSFRSSH